eukprot:11815969-Alexandrium_andersonii.AAC.1
MRGGDSSPGISLMLLHCIEIESACERRPRTPDSPKGGVCYPEYSFFSSVISGRGVSFYIGYTMQVWVQEGTIPRV